MIEILSELVRAKTPAPALAWLGEEHLVERVTTTMDGLLLRLGERLHAELSAEHVDEFAALIDDPDSPVEAHAQWLQLRVPNYQEITVATVHEVTDEIARSIIAAYARACLTSDKYAFGREVTIDAASEWDSSGSVLAAEGL